MAEENARPGHDEPPARVKGGEAQAKRGKLKIFLGYVAGVGKTYHMLEAARQRQKGTDVVVACVETHGQRDLEALLEGLETIPRRHIEYRGAKLTEMDIDAVLARRPRLALVDELAHENAPGSRHPKRYQDVEELLDAGIDVYTTLNIQHVESGRNVVEQVTGVWVRESVPDSIIDSAAEIEVVDLPPDELLKRLQEGKVHVPEQIAAATERFFRKENLTALRELTMRTAVRHVDEETQDYLKAHGIRGPWPSGERILLFIGPGSSGSHLVRSARRLAYELGVEWSALYVETLDSARLPQGQQERIMESLRLAQRLGAKITTIQRESIVTAVMEYLKANNITKLVLAKPPKKSFWGVPGRSIADQIIDQSTDVDVHLVDIGGERARRGRPDRMAIGNRWRGYWQGIGIVVLATLLGKAAPNFFTEANIIMVYLLCVGATAYFWGFGPSVLVSLLSVLSFDFLFVVPFYTFTVNDTRYLFTFIVLLLVGLAISYFTGKIRQHAEVVMSHERQTAALYALGRDLAVSHDLASYVRAITRRATESFGRQALIFLPDKQSGGALKPYGDSAGFNIDENELAAAVWSFEHQKVSGPGTDTLPDARARYLPLVTMRGPLGVLALSMTGAGELTMEQERILEAYADLAAVAIESVLEGQEALDAQVLTNTEKLVTSLLNAISHDLSAPLMSIIGTLSRLQEEGANLDGAARKNLVQVAREDAERLNHLITNLLDEARIKRP